MDSSEDKSLESYGNQEQQKLLRLKRPDATIIPIGYSFTRETRKPLLFFLNLIGIHDGESKSRGIQVYRITVLALLLIASIRRGSQVTIRNPNSQFDSFQDVLFDPNVVLSLNRFLFVLAGFVTASMLRRCRHLRKDFLQTIDNGMDPEYAASILKKTRRTAITLVIITAVMCFFAASLDITYKIGLLTGKRPWLPPLITSSFIWLPLEGYLVVLAQGSTTMVAVDFFMSCTLLRYLVKDVCQHMRKDFKDSPTLVKIHYLDQIQTHHHQLTLAMTKLEDCYSFTVFIYYSFAIPCTCFLAYIAYRNAGTNPGVTIGMGVWITTIIILLLIMSLPAFQLTEDGEAIKKAVFHLYQSNLKGEEDPRIATQFTILISQIQSHEITVSAHNYFPINRGMLLSMFSVIFTYFLILVQFSEGDVQVSSAALVNAIEYCRNATKI